VVEEQATIKDYYTPINEVFYIHDTQHICKSFADNLEKSTSEGDSIMVRDGRNNEFSTSGQMGTSQTVVKGFIDCASLIERARTTKWRTEKVFQAVEAEQLYMHEPTFVKSDDSLSKVLDCLSKSDLQLAIVREHPLEVGVITLD